MYQSHPESSSDFSLLGREAECLQNEGRVSVPRWGDIYSIGEELTFFIDMDRAQIRARISRVSSEGVDLERLGPVDWNPDYQPYF